VYFCQTKLNASARNNSYCCKKTNKVFVKSVEEIIIETGLSKEEIEQE